MEQVGEPIPFVLTTNMEYTPPTNYSVREYYEELVLQHVVIYIYRERISNKGAILASDSPTLTELDKKIRNLAKKKFIPRIANEIFKRIKEKYNIKVSYGERYEEESNYKDNFLLLFMSFKYKRNRPSVDNGIVKIYSDTNLDPETNGKWFNIVFSDNQIILYHHAADTQI